MDIYPTNGTVKGNMALETCTETPSLGQRQSSMVSSVPINPIISSSLETRSLLTAAPTGTETSSCVSTERIQQISLAEPLQASSAQDPDYSSLPQQPTGHNSTGLSMGAHVGIGISAGLALAVVCCAAGWHWRMRRRRREAEAAEAGVAEHVSPVGRIPELDGGWPVQVPRPRSVRSAFRRSLRESWYLVLQRNQDQDVPPLPKSPELDPEMSFLDLTPSDAKSRRSSSKT